MNEILRRRRALMAAQKGEKMFSGELTTERPTASGTVATLQAPNCSHFLIHAKTEPSLNTGKAFLSEFYCENNVCAFGLGSNAAGTNTTGSAQVSPSITPGTNPNFAGEFFVIFEATQIRIYEYAGNGYKILQDGLTYVWYAW